MTTNSFFRRFEFWPTFMTLIAVATMLALGFWQIQRLHWKSSLIASVERARTMPPVNMLPANDAELPALVYRKATLTGEFLPQLEFPVAARYYKSVAGYHLVNPFRLKDGRLLLINRGWVPSHQPGKPSTHPAPQGQQTVTGMLRLPEGKRRFLPDPKPGQNLWFSVDLETIEKASGKSFLPVVLEITGKDDGHTYPVPLTGDISLRNDHLGYAITWFGVAAAAIGIFLLYHRQKP